MAAMEVPAAIQRFLDSLQTANWDGIEDYYTPDAVYDATVPGWRAQYEGASRIARELREEWTGRHPWRIVELHVAPTTNGVVVDLELRKRGPDDGHQRPQEVGRRLASIFRLEDGRIAEHRYFSCGEWDEETLRRIEAQAPKLRRPAPL